MLGLLIINKKENIILLYVLSIIIAYGIIFWIFKKNFKSLNTLLDGIYFSATTFFSVGYGDIYPLTYYGKLLVLSKYLFILLFLLKL